MDSTLLGVIVGGAIVQVGNSLVGIINGIRESRSDRRARIRSENEQKMAAYAALTHAGDEVARNLREQSSPPDHYQKDEARALWEHFKDMAAMAEQSGNRAVRDALRAYEDGLTRLRENTRRSNTNWEELKMTRESLVSALRRDRGLKD